jgi:hypothetical protein
MFSNIWLRSKFRAKLRIIKGVEDNSMRKKIITKNLEKALLQDGKLEIELYKWELEENVQFYGKSKQQDQDQYLLAITENNNDVAMLIIDEQDNLLINEAARDKLKQLWQNNYEQNLKKLIPKIAQDLSDGYIFYSGINVLENLQRSWQSIKNN